MGRSDLTSKIGAATLSLSGSSADPAERLAAMRGAVEVLDDWRRDAISQSREAGMSWAAIADALGVSEKDAWAFYNADLTEMMRRSQEASNLTEEEAMEIALAEVKAVRAERRGETSPR